MFSVRDYSLFQPSPNAARAFRRLRRLDMAVNGLLAVLVLAAIWNIARLVHLRLIDNQPLADVKDIADDPSSRAIWLLTLVTVGVIGVREWLVGERSIGLIYPLGALLALVLVPAMMTEIQPRAVDHTLRIMMYDCPPKAIVNGSLRTLQVCDPRQIAAGDVLMANADPTTGEFDLIDPSAGGQNTMTFTMSGRGTYTVYFMFLRESPEACDRSLLLPVVGTQGDLATHCAVIHGASWQVMPWTTSGNSPAGVNLVEVTLPE